MDQVMEWITNHQIIVAVIIFLFGKKYLPTVKKLAVLTPTKTDDALIAAIESCVGDEQTKEYIVSELAERLTKEQLVTLIKLWKEKHNVVAKST